MLMNVKTHNANKKITRQELRKQLTPAERKLWTCLQRSQLGYKFRRQHGIGRYIADFYCPEKRLVIELDGSQHLDDKEYDAERTKYMEELNIYVLRFWNDQVMSDIGAVIDRIRNVLENRDVRFYYKTTPTPPYKRRGERLRIDMSN